MMLTPAMQGIILAIAKARRAFDAEGPEAGLIKVGLLVLEDVWNVSFLDWISDPNASARPSTRSTPVCTSSPRRRPRRGRTRGSSTLWFTSSRTTRPNASSRGRCSSSSLIATSASMRGDTRASWHACVDPLASFDWMSIRAC